VAPGITLVEMRRREEGIKLNQAPTGSTWRRWYRSSVAREVIIGLDDVQFGERIITFGAEMLLFVLPIVILLSAFASTRIDDDLARHIGLDAHGSMIIAELFRHPAVSFNSAILLSLVLSLAGTIGVAGSVQVMYERAFSLDHFHGLRSVLRCAAWAGSVGALLIVDSLIDAPVHRVPAGIYSSSVINFATLVAFFWWSAHFLLAGRVSWRKHFPSALATAILFVGLGVFSSFYFSKTVISDNNLFGSIGVVFSLVTWFISIGAVIAIGAVIRVVWQRRRATRSEAARRTDAAGGNR
jgi:membrane protein